MEQVIKLIVVVFIVFTTVILVVAYYAIALAFLLTDCYASDPTNDANAVGMQPISMSQTNICVEDPTDCEDHTGHSNGRHQRK